MRRKALVLFLVTLALAASAWAAGTESVIYNFNNYSGDGYYPYSGLVADKAGESVWRDLPGRQQRFGLGL